MRKPHQLVFNNAQRFSGCQNLEFRALVMDFLIKCVYIEAGGVVAVTYQKQKVELG